MLVSPAALLQGFKSASGTSGANASITVTLSSSSGMKHYVGAVIWSYSDTPTGGKLTSTGLDGDEVDIDILVGGPGPFSLPPVVGDASGAVSFTLAAGGGGVVGKLWVLYRTLPN